MKELINNMLEKKKWAVVGVTQNQMKFGYKIYKKLQKFGYEVYPVNPGYDEIDGDICYNTLDDLPVKVDCVSVVVGIDKSIKAIDEIVGNKIENVWFQPNTYNIEVIEKATEMNLNVVYNNCVLFKLNGKGVRS